MKAISNCLYFTQKYYQDIQNQCIKFSKNLIYNNEIPYKLKILEKKHFIDEYELQPSLPAYDYINFHLISLIYKKKILIYSIDYISTNLSCEIYNNGFKEKIELFSKEENKYESCFEVDYIDNSIFCQNIIFNLINNISEEEKTFKILNDGKFINIEHEYYLKKKKKNNRKDSMLTKSHSEKYWNNDFNVFTFGLNNCEKLLTLIRERRNSSLDQSLMSIYEKENKNLIKYKNEEEEKTIIKRKKTKSVSPDLKNNLHLYLNKEESDFKSKLKNLKENNITFQNFKKKNINVEELNNDNKRYTGKLKFFDEYKNYGFFVLDLDGTDLFVHYDDLKKWNIQKDKIAKYVYNTVFSFIIFKYKGKHNESRKAIEIKLEK